ncbi:uncharacterized protein LOC118511211 [Anopheles stephensi]|uniref:uncharacterized protein LOC118511211 n=1 Tax=Anopheles stephensi TaxID=30069 RepID=UPI0016589734|nr:uncharacterized protein LOC118511211 [Anopheles stephensi]
MLLQLHRFQALCSAQPSTPVTNETQSVGRSVDVCACFCRRWCCGYGDHMVSGFRDGMLLYAPKSHHRRPVTSECIATVLCVSSIRRQRTWVVTTKAIHMPAGKT